MNKLRQSIRISTSGATIRTAFVGGLLIWLSILIVPLLFLLGFLAQFVETVLDSKESNIEDKEQIPFFGRDSSDPTRTTLMSSMKYILGDGARIAILWTIYFVIPILLSGPLLLFNLAPDALSPAGFIWFARIEFPAIFIGGTVGFLSYIGSLFGYAFLISINEPSIPTIFIASTSSVLLSVVATFLFPASIISYVSAASGSIGDGIRFNRVRRIAGSQEYRHGWLVATVIVLIGWMIHLLGYTTWYFIDPLTISELQPLDDGVTIAAVSGILLFTTSVYFYSLLVGFTYLSVSMRGSPALSDGESSETL